MKRLLSIALVLGGALIAVNAAEWNEFRGSGKQGETEVAGLPDSWNASRGVVWKTDVQGRGWSSPVVGGGKVFVTSAVERGENFEVRVLAFDADTGKQVFNVKPFDLKTSHASRKHKKNGFASPTPIFNNKRVYVHFGHMGTACLSENGKTIWVNQGLDFPPVHGNGGSPELVDDVLIFSCDGKANPFVVGLSAKTGKEIWRHMRDSGAKKKFSFSTPLVIEVEGKKQVISPGSGEVSALDPATGKEIWKCSYNQGYSVIPRPVYGHGMVFIGTGYDRPTVMAIRADGKGDVTSTHVEWTIRKGAPNTPSLLLVGNELYFVSDGGIGSCVNAKTGELHWNERLGGNYSASPLYGDGKIYFQNEQGEAVVLKAGKRFEIVSRNDMGEKTFASYAVIGSDFLIRTESKLYRIGIPANTRRPL